MRTRLRVDLDGALDAAAVKRSFLRVYRKRYGNAYEDQPIQIVNLRVTAWRDQPPPPVTLDFAAGGELSRKGERAAFDPRSRTMIPHAVHATARLRPGEVIRGPAIFEEESSTCIMGHGAVATVDARGWLDIALDSE